MSTKKKKCHHEIRVCDSTTCKKTTLLFKHLLSICVKMSQHIFITLFIFITMFCGTDNIPWNISCYSYIMTECGKYQGMSYGIFSVPHNIVMNLNNVMLYATLCNYGHRIHQHQPRGIHFQHPIWM